MRSTGGAASKRRERGEAAVEEIGGERHKQELAKPKWAQDQAFIKQVSDARNQEAIELGLTIQLRRQRLRPSHEEDEDEG